MKTSWLETVKKTFPDVHAPGFPAYPLLGSELSADEQRAGQHPWRLRLALCREPESDEWEALLQDVQELRLSFEPKIAPHLLTGIDIFSEASARPDCWALTKREPLEMPHWSTEQSTWKRHESVLTERTVTLDGHFLKNLSLLRTVVGKLAGVDRWVVGSAVSADGETEGLIADTIAYWTGAVGGAEVLEVAQQPGESFDTLWARLNICRLLRWESDLGEPGDALAGSGFFAELAQNLSSSTDSVG